LKQTKKSETQEVSMPIAVTRNGNAYLPNAITFTPNGTRATITTSQFDGVLTVGAEYAITVTAPTPNPGNYTAKYVDVDVVTYKFDNLHQS
jgi:hypothetical protein